MRQPVVYLIPYPILISEYNQMYWITRILIDPLQWFKCKSISILKINLNILFFCARNLGWLGIDPRGLYLTTDDIDKVNLTIINCMELIIQNFRTQKVDMLE